MDARHRGLAGGSGQDSLDEGGLGLLVGTAVGFGAGGEAAFEGGVFGGGGGVGAEVVTEGEHVGVVSGGEFEHVEVVGAAAVGDADDEVVAAGDTALAAEFPADALERGDGDAGFFPVVDADEDVDDGFGGEAGDGGAADVVDGLDVGGDGVEDSGAGVGEEPWPGGVVGDDSRGWWCLRGRPVFEGVGHGGGGSQFGDGITLAGGMSSAPPRATAWNSSGRYG